MELELLVGDGRDAGGVVELRSAVELRLRFFEGWSELVMCVGSGCSGFCRQRGEARKWRRCLESFGMNGFKVEVIWCDDQLTGVSVPVRKREGL